MEFPDELAPTFGEIHFQAHKDLVDYLKIPAHSSVSHFNDTRAKSTPKTPSPHMKYNFALNRTLRTCA